MSGHLQAVLFDLDGVIVDTARLHYQAWKKLADQEKIPFDQQINERLKGVSREQSLEIILERASRTYTTEEKKQMSDSKNAWYVEALQTLNEHDILPGVHALLHELREHHIKTAICSASKNTRTILENLGITAQFDTIVTGHDTVRTKPDPQVFLIAAERLEIQPSDCVIVEDSAAGIEAARRCNMRSIGIGDRGHLGMADRVVSDLKHVTLEFLNGMFKRPNIVIFNPDQCRADAIHHLGNKASHTPNFDRLAKTDGISFSHAFVQNPVCTPSRCTFMTGLYPHNTGHRTIHSMLQPYEKSLLQSLKEDDYFVWWGGKNDLIPADSDFSKVCDVKYQPKKKIRDVIHKNQEWRGTPDGDNYYSFYLGKLPDNTEDTYNDKDWAFVDGAVDFIEEYEGDKPFCMYMPLGFPHPPYRVEEPFFSMIDRDHLEPRIPKPENTDLEPAMLDGIRKNQHLDHWTEERYNELRAVYLGMVARIDYQFGLLVQALKKKGIYDDTIIFVFSDHGDFTGDYGLVEKNQNTFQDCLTNVPFMIKPAKWMNAKTGVIRDDLVELVDFYATAQDLVKFEPDHFQFGKSLLPVLQGDMGTRDIAFCEGGRLMEEQHTRESESKINTVPSGLYWPRLCLQIGEGVHHGKAAMFRSKDYKYVRRLYEMDEFYDLKKDPDETQNRIHDPEYQEILAQFKEKALNFYMKTGDVVKLKPDLRA